MVKVFFQISAFGPGFVNLTFRLTAYLPRLGANPAQVTSLLFVNEIDFENPFHYAAHNTEVYMAAPLPTLTDTLPVLPPAPHNPHERVCLREFGPWQLLIFARNTSKHAYFAPRGMLHLQLWAPAAGLSILTPSKLTGDMLELWEGGERHRFKCYRSLLEYISEKHALRIPHPHMLSHYTLWYLRAAEIGAIARPHTSALYVA